MYTSINWLAVPALLALFTLGARGAPASMLRVESVEAAANRTLCPYTVEADVDLKREPQRIKVIKCLSPDKTHTAAHHHRAHGHAHSCSDVRAASAAGAGARAQCVELHDVMRVSYGALKTTLDVAVGCACMFLEHGTALEPEDVLG